MNLIPEQLARDPQQNLLVEAEQHRIARVLARQRRAERRERNARLQAVAAREAARHAALAAQHLLVR